jgi:TetR/AcrR family transcriptional regulator
MRRSLVKPTAMLLFGMLNWTHTWYRPDGALAPEQLAALAGDLFLSGLDALAGGRRLAG